MSEFRKPSKLDKNDVSPPELGGKVKRGKKKVEFEEVEEELQPVDSGDSGDDGSVAVVKPKKERKPRAKKEPSTKPKRAPNVWNRALTEFNKDKNGYSIPKKGTDEYAEVSKIMEKLKLADGKK